MTVTFDVVDPNDDEARWAMTQYFDELGRRFADGFDPGDALGPGSRSMAPPHGAFVVAHAEGEPVACGGVQTISDGIGEIKRMWVADTARGRGLGRRMLETLEDQCRRLGHHTVRLDTNSQLPEAVALYQQSGYHPIERYNDNPYPDHFFEKSLTAPDDVDP